LFALISQMMRDEDDGPALSWQIMLCAIRNADAKLVSRILQAQLPVYMTNPNVFLRKRHDSVDDADPLKLPPSYPARAPSLGATAAESSWTGSRATMETTVAPAFASAAGGWADSSRFPSGTSSGVTIAGSGANSPRRPGVDSADESSSDEEAIVALDVDALVDAAIREDTEAGDSGGGGYEGGYVPWKFACRDHVRMDPVMGWARVDMSLVEENLLHVALEQEHSEEDNKTIFNLLLTYVEQLQQQRSFVLSNHDVIAYPWPQGGGELLQLTWRNSYGQNSFHVCANRKNPLPSALNAYYFKRLLEMDVHAVVTRLDASGFAPLHYAAYHNKPEIVTALIDLRIDLAATTNTTMRHTPLHLAALKGNWSITLSLLEADVPVDVIDKEGCTPLALAMLARQNLLQVCSTIAGACACVLVCVSRCRAVVL